MFVVEKNIFSLQIFINVLNKCCVSSVASNLQSFILQGSDRLVKGVFSPNILNSSSRSVYNCDHLTHLQHFILIP